MRKYYKLIIGCYRTVLVLQGCTELSKSYLNIDSFKGTNFHRLDLLAFISFSFFFPASSQCSSPILSRKSIGSYYDTLPHGL